MSALGEAVQRLLGPCFYSDCSTLPEHADALAAVVEAAERAERGCTTLYPTFDGGRAKVAACGKCPACVLLARLTALRESLGVGR